MYTANHLKQSVVDSDETNIGVGGVGEGVEAVEDETRTLDQQSEWSDQGVDQGRGQLVGL
jgi:hypothetical protein